MSQHLLIDKIRHNVIGGQHSIATAFGRKPLVYADYTASGRALTFIEDMIQSMVLPFYANTHTETSLTGAQTTLLREQARAQIKASTGAGDQYKVIFCGSGATAAIDKLIDILNLRLPADLDSQYHFSKQIAQQDRPVVFIGPYEHHSNELPWRESIATLVSIPLNSDGHIDTQALEQALVRYQDRKLKIASFSAASNVTGIKSKVNLVSSLLHQYQCLAFWDYAAAAPYVAVNMQGDDTHSYKDAVFLSPHKFIGGPGTPGILVVNENLLKNRVPAVQGGGTVVYVTPNSHRYIDDLERREEGGTPAIIESIRAGLVFKLQHDVGIEEIMARESAFIKEAMRRFEAHSNIHVLGQLDAERLSIASFNITHQGKNLHYGFVVALLNDLFGIQARGGCSCAGPYGHHLLAMDTAYSQALEQQILKGDMILRPGWIRLNFNYFIDTEHFDYLVEAIILIAKHGWRLLPFYHFDVNDGVWRYQGRKTKLVYDWKDFDFHSITTQSDNKKLSLHLSLHNEHQHSLNLHQHLKLAHEELLAPRDDLTRYSVQLSSQAESLRWFVLPQDILLPCAIDKQVLA